MGKKCIIEFEDKPFHKDGDFLYRAKGFNSLVFDMTGIGKLTPYTEPDLEQVRCAAYEEGRNSLLIEVQKAGKNTIKLEEDEYYQRGLSDAWDAARKICSMNSVTRDEIFGMVITSNIIDENTAAEVIEKLKAHEQKYEEIKVGDEVTLKCGVRPAIYMQGTKGSDEIYLLFNDGSCGLHSKSEIERKTGRHFPEIAAVLEKMRGEQDG